MIWTFFGFVPLYTIIVATLLLAASGLEYLRVGLGLTLPEHELHVGLNKKDVAFSRLLMPGAADSFSPSQREDIAKLPGVRQVHAISYGSEPCQANVVYFGQSFRTEMVVQGFQPDMLQGPLQEKLREWQPGQPIPIVINNNVLAIYNHAYSKSQGLPELSEAALKVPFVTLIYGRSGTMPIRVQARVVGLSPKVALGAAIPLDALTYMHKEMGIAPPAITELKLKLAPNANEEAVAKSITEMGFIVNEQDPFNNLASRIEETIVGVGWPVLIALCLMAALFLTQGYAGVMEVKRSHYQRLQTEEGAVRNRIGFLLGLEGLAWIIGFVLLATLDGLWLADWLRDAHLQPTLSNLTGQDIPLNFQINHVLMVNSLVIVSCLLLTIPRIYSTTRLDLEN